MVYNNSLKDINNIKPCSSEVTACSLGSDSLVFSAAAPWGAVTYPCWYTILMLLLIYYYYILCWYTMLILLCWCYYVDILLIMLIYCWYTMLMLLLIYYVDLLCSYTIYYILCWYPAPAALLRRCAPAALRPGGAAASAGHPEAGFALRVFYRV